jgi:hypothetical protein
MGTVPLREHFEALLSERDKALAVQTMELHRRLDGLNHAHDQAVEVQRTYVTEEKFDAFVARFEENKAVTAEALTLARGNVQGRTERRGDQARGLGLQIAAGSLFVAVCAVITVVATRGG